MKMIKCESCTNEISPKAATCPKCGHPNKKAKALSGVQIIMGLVAGGVAIWIYTSIGGNVGDKLVAQQIANVEAEVAADAVKEYEIAKRQGDAMQICVQAGFVSAAYLQAKNESHYQQWKATEKGDCKRAGVLQ